VRRITKRGVPLQPAKARHLKIKYELQLAGSSFNDIARDLGVTHSTVLAVSNGRGGSSRVQLAISEKIGVPLEELWPEKFPEQTGESS